MTTYYTISALPFYCFSPYGGVPALALFLFLRLFCRLKEGACYRVILFIACFGTVPYVLYLAGIFLSCYFAHCPGWDGFAVQGLMMIPAFVLGYPLANLVFHSLVDVKNSASN